MPKLKLQIMDETGDSQIRYDPKDKAKVKEVIETIKQRLKEGYELYGAKVGGELERIAGPKDLKPEKLEKTLEELDRFMLAPGQKLLSPPMSPG